MKTGRVATRSTATRERSSLRIRPSWIARARATRLPDSSADEGDTASAAPVGVEARTSATRSAMVVSGSWPMPVTTGTGHAAMARASPSSLKGMRSSYDPPPRTSRTASAPARDTQSMPRTSSCGARAPSTGTPATRTLASGQRRRSVRKTSCTASPRGEVTRPTTWIFAGTGRFRDSSVSPSK